METTGDVSLIKKHAVGLIENDTIKKVGRVSKKVQFVTEREETLKKLMEILKINESRMYFYIHDIEKKEICDSIINLTDSVIKFFCVKTRHFYRKTAKRPALSIVRTVFEEMEYEICCKSKTVEIDGEKVRAKCYLILKK